MMRNQRQKGWAARIDYAALFLFLLGLLLRVWQFGAAPGGLNQDEASIGYDAWSILQTGMDRNGIFLPVHLIAWGSGQNALYAYLSIPFIALFGLNVVSVRMVNLLFGLLSVVLTFLILNRLTSRRCAYVGMALAAMTPWGVMASRWGLESNLFPPLFLLAFYILLLGLERRKLLPVATALFALSLYSYGAAYVVVPLFCLGAAIFLLVTHRVPLRYVGAGFASFVVVALPIGLFVLTNLFHWGNLSIFGFTAPEMTGVTRLFTATESHTVSDSLRAFFDNVILQTDSMLSNRVEGYGTLFPLSLPFAAAGIARSILLLKKEKNSPILLLPLGFLAGCTLFFIYAWTNINRVNIVFPFLLLFTAIGLDWLCSDWKKLSAVGLCYAVLLCGFVTEYFGKYNQSISSSFYSSFGDAIQKAEQSAGEEEIIYVTTKINSPYIYALFYTQTPPAEYHSTVKIADLHVEFQRVVSFGHFVFGTDGLEKQTQGIYILPNSEAEKLKGSAALLAEFERYSVWRIGDASGTKTGGA